MSTVTRRWVILIPILIGVAVILFLKENKQEPVQSEVAETAKLVRVISVSRLTLIPKAVGYGTVRPGTTWEAVSEVKGKIIERHPELEKGSVIEAGARLIRIDAADYELAIAQAEAEIEAIEAQLLELETRRNNTRQALRIEREALTLNQKELERKRKLVGQGGISRSDLESQEQALLVQQQKLQSQQNTLNLLPSQKALLEAQLASQHTRLASALRDLEQTSVVMPFTGRIAEVNAELYQYVREGESLVVADSLQLAEVEAHIPMEQMSSLVYSDQPLNLHGVMAGDPNRFVELDARVSLKEGVLNAQWQGRFSRISDTLDPKTRTVGVIIEVDDPYSGVQPGVRPPLFKGMFVRVDLSGRPRPESLVIPRLALHDGRVYLVNRENRLELRPVAAAMTQAEYLVVKSGLEAGEQVVISDLVPAIEGMLLKPMEDEAAKAELIRAASDRG